MRHRSRVRASVGVWASALQRARAEGVITTRGSLLAARYQATSARRPWLSRRRRRTRVRRRCRGRGAMRWEHERGGRVGRRAGGQEVVVVAQRPGNANELVGAVCYVLWSVGHGVVGRSPRMAGRHSSPSRPSRTALRGAGLFFGLTGDCGLQIRGVRHPASWVLISGPRGTIKHRAWLRRLVDLAG
jgi:hypothetical protein